MMNDIRQMMRTPPPWAHDMTLGEMMYIKRWLHKLSMREVGEACGYRRAGARYIVYRWENDRALVPLKHVRTLSRMLGIPLEYFLPVSVSSPLPIVIDEIKRIKKKPR